jgi:hypothetical protein
LWFLLRLKRKKTTTAVELVGDHAHSTTPQKSMSTSPVSGAGTEPISEPLSEMPTEGHERMELPPETSVRAELPTDFNLGVDRHFQVHKPT